MNGQVISAKIKIPKSNIPNGTYHGIWGGYEIIFTAHSIEYELQTEEGVRGRGFKVLIKVRDGIITFEDED